MKQMRWEKLHYFKKIEKLHNLNISKISYASLVLSNQNKIYLYIRVVSTYVYLYV